tara:strand:+ start:10973 stop:12346 length:1374 start_codon:yes stop_codon:yes gene_type:complete
MSTTKEKDLIECITGDWHPSEEVYKLYDGGYIHELDTEGFVELSSDCGNSDDGKCFWHPLNETIYVDSSEEYYPVDNYHDFDIEWDHCIDGYEYTENMNYGWVSRSEEGWFSNDSDYVYSDRDDLYFMNCDIAYNRDYEYCENQDDYVHVDDLDGPSDADDWDNTWIQVADNNFNKTFNMQYTFGVEIETCDGYMDFNKDLNLKAVYDGSINGKEYVTGCLSGTEGVDMLKKICNSLSSSDCYVDSTCGVHVHIGGARFNRRFSILSIMLGCMLEKEIFSMLPKSRQKSSYCFFIPAKFYKLRTVNKRLYPRTYKRMLNLLSEYVYRQSSQFDKNNCKKSSHPGGRYASSRYKWLNLNNCSYEKTGPETIEFRCHSASKEFDKIYNWVLICMCFVRYVENNSRQIIDSYNKWIKGHRPHETSGGVTLHDIVSEGLGKDANVLLEYIDKRKDKFLNQD